jgi:hypothetical protein
MNSIHTLRAVSLVESLFDRMRKLKMLKTSKYVVSTIAVLAASVSAAFAAATPLGDPLSGALSVTMGTVMPFADGGILGLAAAGVIGGVWLARRKR